MDIFKAKHIHFTGIKGVAMTALALCAQDLGIKVSGTDTKELFVTDEVLKERNIGYDVGFCERDWKEKPDLLITTGAHGGLNNLEVCSAGKKGIPVMTQGEALSFFSQGKDLIVTSGVGGKTTIAAIIATILELSGFNPSYAIGVGKIFPLGFPGKYDRKGKHFVCEGDEFAVSLGVDNRPKFTLLNPKAVVVTNIEHDHPDVYPTIKDTKKAFKEFFLKILENGILVASSDNENTMEVIKDLKVNIQTYGLKKDSDWRIKEICFKKGKNIVSFSDRKGKNYVFRLNIPGVYNAKNALAAFIVSRFLGVREDKIISGLEKFMGTKRRFEKIGETKSGVLVFDDYAHHPGEIKSVLKTAKDYFPGKRIIAIFQPHTYSRTKALFEEFAQSFKDADIVGLMDIYSSAREKPDKDVSSGLLAKETGNYQKDVYYSKGHKSTLSWFKEISKKGDLVLTLGAGDIFYLHEKMLKL